MAPLPLNGAVIGELNARHKRRAAMQNFVRWIVCLALAAALILLFASGYWQLGVLLSLSGGIGLAFAAGRLSEAVRLLRKGLLVSPRERWGLTLGERSLEIRVAKRMYSVPQAQLQGATFLADGSMESFASVVDALVLHFAELPDLAIPRTAEGCSEAIDVLFRRGLLTRVDV